MQILYTNSLYFTQYLLPPPLRSVKLNQIMGFLLRILLLHSLSLPNKGSPPDLGDSTTSADDDFSESFLSSMTVH